MPGRELNLGGIISHPIGSDRGHPRSFKGYPGVQKERGIDCGVGRRLLG